jgi:hypothetical protein
VCKERYAEFRKDDETALYDATMKRKELNLQDASFPDAPSMSLEDWEKLYSFSLQISDVVVSKSEKRRRNRIGELKQVKPILNDTSNDSNSNDEVVSVDGNDTKQSRLRTSKKQVFQYNDYKLTFLPQKGELLISYDTDEDSKNIKIKNGIFPQDGDFYLKDGNLYMSDLEEKTPLKIDVERSKITISFIDNNETTGISLSFEYNLPTL